MAASGAAMTTESDSIRSKPGSNLSKSHANIERRAGRKKRRRACGRLRPARWNGGDVRSEMGRNERRRSGGLGRLRRHSALSESLREDIARRPPAMRRVRLLACKEKIGGADLHDRQNFRLWLPKSEVQPPWRARSIAGRICFSMTPGVSGPAWRRWMMPFPSITKVSGTP